MPAVANRTMKILGFRFQSRSQLTGKKAKQVANALYEIELRSGLNADSVLDAARERSSILHDLFDWDDTVAAEKWRRQQAANLVRSVHVIYEESDTGNRRESRAFMSVEREEREYLRVETVMTDQNLRDQVLQRALAEAEQWRKRYEDMRELAEVFSAIEVTERRIRKG